MGSDLVLLLLTGAAVVTLAALAARVQSTLHGDFDLTPAAAILISGQVFVSVTNAAALGKLSLLLGSVVGLLSAAGILVFWNVLRTRLSGRTQAHVGPFLYSVAITSLASSLVGLSRGPGLQQVNWGPAPNVTTYIHWTFVAFSVFILILLYWWLHSPAGLRVSLLGQDRKFAVEIGITSAQAAIGAGLASGLTSGSLGLYLASSIGVTPSNGTAPLLFGIAVAVLTARRSFFVCSLVGGLVGASHASLRTFASDSMADLVFFSFAAVALVILGVDRSSEGLR